MIFVTTNFPATTQPIFIVFHVNSKFNTSTRTKISLFHVNNSVEFNSSLFKLSNAPNRLRFSPTGKKREGKVVKILPFQRCHDPRLPTSAIHVNHPQQQSQMPDSKLDSSCYV